MIWLFERGQDAVRIETRYDNENGEFVSTIFWSDGRSESERFKDEPTFRARLGALERQLTAEHWRQIGSPTLLANGWRGGSVADAPRDVPLTEPRDPVKH